VRLSGVLQDLLEALAHDAIAAADGSFEARAVRDRDDAAALVNQPGALQGADDQADGGTLHAQHRGQVLMGERQGIPASAVVQGQNPAAAARLHAVHGVAGHRLQGLCQQRFDELQAELARRRTSVSRHEAAPLTWTT
jgi:hypothetical protein